MDSLPKLSKKVNLAIKEYIEEYTEEHRNICDIDLSYDLHVLRETLYQEETACEKVLNNLILPLDDLEGVVWGCFVNANWTLSIIVQSLKTNKRITCECGPQDIKIYSVNTYSVFSQEYSIEEAEKILPKCVNWIKEYDV